MKRKKRALCLFLLSLAPLVLGVVGYQIDRISFADALYAAIALYRGEVLYDSDNLYLEVARWTALLATTTIVLRCFQNLWNVLSCQLLSRFSDSVAVYSKRKITFGDGVHAFYSERAVKHAASHIIIKENDRETLCFYEENRDTFRGKKVYIGLTETEPGLIRENPGLFIFDINSAIAGMLWKDAALWRMQKKNLSVVLYGGSDLAGCILSTGVLLNLFSPEQQIQYHNIGANPFAVRHSGFLTGNGDTIRFLSKKEEAIWEIIRHGDIVIVAEELPISELQSVLVNCRNAKQVYYYSRFDGDYGDLVHLPELKPFGRETEIYTDENIRKEALIQDAVELNRQYTVQNHAETDWNKLSGFLKCSNISAADYRRVLEELLKQPNPPATEALAELEHIRWCRFHYLNYWSYGIPENGKTKDARKKIHSCLRPYKKLSKEEQEKDLRFIRELKAGETV